MSVSCGDGFPLYQGWSFVDFPKRGNVANSSSQRRTLPCGVLPLLSV